MYEVLSLFKEALDPNPNIEKYWMSYVHGLITNKQIANAKWAIRKPIT